MVGSRTHLRSTRLLAPTRPAGRSLTWLSDEAVDGLVGVVLKRRVADAGDEFGLVDHRTIQLVGRAGVERAARQGRVGDTVDEPLRSHVKFVGEAQGGHDVLGGYPHRQWEATSCSRACGVAGAYGDEAAVGVFSGQVAHPERPDVLRLPEGEVEVRLAVGEVAAVDD